MIDQQRCHRRGVVGAADQILETCHGPIQPNSGAPREKRGRWIDGAPTGTVRAATTGEHDVSVTERGQETGLRVLSPQQQRYFEAFGFVVVPGLFRDDITEIDAAFEAVFADPDTEAWEMIHEGYRHEPRVALGDMADRHPRLAAVRDDPRMHDVAHDVLGPGAIFPQSGGNIFKCEAEWHLDGRTTHVESRTIKFALYLDPLVKGVNALRVMPGSHQPSAYADLVEELCGFGETTANNFGVPGEDLPYWEIASEPGDLVLYDFQTQHASYGSTAPRRVFNLNGCVPTA